MATSRAPRRWGTRFGFYMAAVGTAFGLGNIWRFPFVVAENGGGAFVLVYLALVFLVGMPFLIGELLLGKVTGSAVLPAMRNLGQGDQAAMPFLGTRQRRQSLIFSGYLPIVVCLLVLAYYSVISGWVLHFLVRFLFSVFSPQGFDPGSSFEVLLTNGWLQILIASVHMILVMIAVAKGVDEGIERWVGKVMPAFFGLVVVLALRSLSMDGSGEAVRFFLYPDFSQLTPASLGRAIGQVCFTLSIGFGTMVTFGSYMSEKVSVPVAGFRVAVFDSVVSFVAGILIFPLVFSRDFVSPGPQLLFETVPFLLAKMPWGTWFGIGFFFCLYLAALGASIGLLETAVANLRETRKLPRPRATLIIGTACFVLSIIPALSSSTLKDYRIGGANIMVAWDSVLVNWMLPIVALLISQVVVRSLDRDVQASEFDNIPSAAMGRLYVHWRFAIKYLAPVLVISGLVLQLL
jgi:neurotransmitter:Na+ symporter, NSS family